MGSKLVYKSQAKVLSYFSDRNIVLGKGKPSLMSTSFCWCSDERILQLFV